MKIYTLSRSVMNYPAAPPAPRPMRRATPQQSIRTAPKHLGYGRPAQSRAGQP